MKTGAVMFALVVALAACRRQPAAAQVPPRLVVVIVVDQLRGDEIDAFAALWAHGMRRLVGEGRVFGRAAHTHGRTETAAGHASLATAAPPRVHGVVNKTMYLPERGQVVGVCDFDPPQPCGPSALVVPTLGDRLRQRWPAAQVVALAQKPCSANLMGGREANLVAWHDPQGLALVGRTPAGPGLPPWLTRFFAEVAGADKVARIWELPRLPPPWNAWPPATSGVRDCGHGLSFPHRLDPGPPGPVLAAQWACSPDSDRAVVETALFAARHMGLGHDDVPDLLWLSLAAVDVVGHHFGPDSLERVAVLTELDRQLGDLLAGLKELVGPRLLVALTADHGVASRPAVAQARGEPAGVVAAASLAATAAAALAAADGLETRVAALDPPYLSLTGPPAQREAAARVAAAALRQAAPVHAAWTAAEAAASADPIAGPVAEGLYPGRSGDVTIVLKPNHLFGDDALGTDHGSPWAYDRHVPLILWGAGVAAGRDDAEVSPLQLGHTLAATLGLEPGGAGLP